MKAIPIVLATLLSQDTQAISQKHHKKHAVKHEIHQHINDFIQLNLQDNQNLFETVNQKLAEIKNLVEVQKLDPSCDAACQSRCDQKADQMIRELKNPLHNITWNCKNNYDVYTTDYDPDHNHFDRISSDVMAMQKTINQIRALEKSTKATGNWDWQSDIDGTDQHVLKQLKRELGVDENAPLPDGIDGMNVREAVYDAVEQHAAKPGSSGFTKAFDLKPEGFEVKV